MSQQQFGTDKDLKKLIRRARKQGWDVRCDGSTHIKVTPTGGASTFRVPLSPGSQRRVRDAIRMFQKSGLQ